MSTTAEPPEAAAIDVAALLPWSAPKRVLTKHGEKDLLKAIPTEAFMDLWATDRQYLANSGISVGPKWKGQPGEMEVCWWRPISKAELAEKRVAVEMSKATGADIQLPVPEGLEYLPYQKAGIRFAAGRSGTLLADEMGLGKTIQAIGVINCNEKIQRVLVVCPATLKINWYRELRKWLVRPLTVGVADSQCFPSTDIVVINYDILHKFDRALSFYWDLLIVDEAHYLKNRKARRSRCVLGYKPSRKEIKAGESGQSSLNARNKIYMTGTPICNKPMDLFPLISSLDPVTWGNWFSYAKRYCGMADGFFGATFSATNESELQRRLRETVMLRRLKADVLLELPPKRRQIVLLPDENGVCRRERDMMGAFEDGIEEMEAKLELAAASEKWEDYQKAVNELSAANDITFTEISRIRHLTAVAKIPQVIEYVDPVLEEDKVILFVHHRDVIDALMAKFGSLAVKIVGGMSGEAKQMAVDRFQTDDSCRLAVCSIMAAGVGITLTASSTVIFGELDWVPGNITQCEDRAHRIGQLKSVNVVHLVIDGSLDARMADVLVDKQRMIERILDKGCQQLTDPAPLLPFKRQRPPSFAEVEKAAADISREQCKAIHAALNSLAVRCDGARAIDGQGFNKHDSGMGKSLAGAMWLTAKQAVIGRRLVNKYRGQLGGAALEACGITTA